MGRTIATAAGVVALVLLALAIGYIGPSQPLIALFASIAVLALGISAANSAAVPLLTFPLILIGYRVSSGTTDLSVSDVALGIATAFAAVFAIRPLSVAMRNMLWLAALYQFATLFTVLLNPYSANVVEWFHAGVLVAGALMVGWAAGRAGLARAALVLFLLGMVVIALGTLVTAALQYAHGDLGAVFPRFPFAMHKNYAGTLLCFGALVVYVDPPWLRFRRWASWGLFGLFGFALATTQSRQAIVALAVSLVVVALRRAPRGHRRSRAIIPLLAIPALVVVVTLVRDQSQSSNQFNSYFQRINWFQDTIGVWLTSPWVGQGLRFWYTDRTAIAFQPPNAELEVLASAGVLGLLAFLIMLLGGLRVLWGVRPEFGTLALVVLLARFVQGQFDIFWVFGQTSIPYLLVGLCLGAAAKQASESPWETRDALSTHVSSVDAPLASRVAGERRGRDSRVA